MEIDASIVQLGAELDAWWDEYFPMLASEDRGAQQVVLALLFLCGVMLIWTSR